MSSKRILSTNSLILVAGLLLVVPAMAGWTSHGERQVSFRAVGPGGLSFEGKGSAITVKEQGDAIVAIVGLDSLNTGIELRDKHMKERYLETHKYPQAVFTVARSKIKVPGETEVEGKLDLHGVSKPIKVHYSASGSEAQGTVTGTSHLNMKDFNIEVPSYLGVSVKPDVTVAFKFGVANK
jgi:polyisoprenoid-binding protein YceI